MNKVRVLAFLGVIALAPETLALTVLPSDPLEGMHSGAVTVKVGDAIRVDASDAVPLFHDDLRAYEKFKSESEAKVAKLLTDRGIAIDTSESASAGVFIWFWGGHSPSRDCEGTNVFTATISVLQPDPGGGNSQVLFEETAIGVARPGEIFETLSKCVDRFLESVRKLQRK